MLALPEPRFLEDLELSIRTKNAILKEYYIVDGHLAYIGDLYGRKKPKGLGKQGLKELNEALKSLGYQEIHFK